MAASGRYRVRLAGEAAVTGTRDRTAEWVLLSYRLPREPSTPRIAVWRKLKRLGVAQISDGLVALPAGPRTREQLEWVSEEIIDAGGTAAIWLARPATRAQEARLTQTMAAARAAEYQAVIAAAAAVTTSDPAARAPAVRRLRNEFRAIQRRDYFPPAERERAQTAVQALTTAPAGTSAKPAQRTRQPSHRAGKSARQPEEETA